MVFSSGMDDHRPQTQETVEQANNMVKSKLRTWKNENGRSDWSKALSVIASQMNCQLHEGLPNRMSPYEVIYGRKPGWTDRVSTHIPHLTEILTEDDEVVDVSSNFDTNREERIDVITDSEDENLLALLRYD